MQPRDVEAIEAVSSYAKSPVDVGQFETQEVRGKDVGLLCEK